MDKLKTPAEVMINFRKQHGLDQAELDKLFGSTSKGRLWRRWEVEGAPVYVGILISYVEAFGMEKMASLLAEREFA